MKKRRGSTGGRARRGRTKEWRRKRMGRGKEKTRGPMEVMPIKSDPLLSCQTKQTFRTRIH